MAKRKKKQKITPKVVEAARVLSEAKLGISETARALNIGKTSLYYIRKTGYDYEKYKAFIEKQSQENSKAHKTNGKEQETKEPTYEHLGALFAEMNKNTEQLRGVFEKIIYLCENNTDSEGTLNEIRTKAKNRVIRYEWREKYGIELDSDARLAEWDYYHYGEYELISFFDDGYKNKKERIGRSISWSEGGKQPVNEWIYSIGFSTGAYIFGEDYEDQQPLFQDFFEELRTFKPDYEDLHNHYLYWKVENAKEIMSKFKGILNKYKAQNQKELNSRKIAKLKAEIKSLTKTK